MDRRIRGIKKDSHGNIVALCNPGESWSPRRVRDIVRDIRSAARSYYVEESGQRTYVRLLSGGVLQTTRDARNANNLSSLPIC